MSQVIKTGLSCQFLYDLLGEYIINQKIYITNSLYKKLVTNHTLDIFLKNIEPFYYSSKKFYCTRVMTYIRFLTVLRQLCQYFKLSYTRKIIYYNSTYETTFLMFV